jgi:mRNA interferase HigB
MHVISYKSLRNFQLNHPDSRNPLDHWFKIARKADWNTLIDIQKTFPSAESVSNFTVFNIKGNKYRLIVSIDYERQLIYIKYVLTHAEYDKENWRNDPYF